jgi:hypothetical protein
VQSEKLLTVRGRSAQKVWAVGGATGPVLKSWDGAKWQAFSSAGLNQPLAGVWTEKAEDLWVAGLFGTTARWDGTTWQNPSPPISTEHFHAVWKHCDDMLFVGGNLFSTSNHYGTIVRFGVGTEAPAVRACD